MEDIYKKLIKAGIIILAVVLVAITLYDPVHSKFLSNKFNKEMERIERENPPKNGFGTVRGFELRDTTKADTVHELDN